MLKFDKTEQELFQKAVVEGNIHDVKRLLHQKKNRC